VVNSVQEAADLARRQAVPLLKQIPSLPVQNPNLKPLLPETNDPNNPGKKEEAPKKP
jgi:hypothetical protein